MASPSRRIKNFLISIDQLAWVIITLGAGHPDETISSAAYRYERMGSTFGKWARRSIDFIFFWEKEHCRLAYESELYRLHHPVRLVEAQWLVRSRLAGERVREQIRASNSKN